jgi:hypothetical protein
MMYMWRENQEHKGSNQEHDVSKYIGIYYWEFQTSAWAFGKSSNVRNEELWIDSEK